MSARFRQMVMPANPLRSISGKLTLFYGALFAGLLALVLVVAQAGIKLYAERLIAHEMETSSKVFDRVAAMRYEQLGDAGRVLAADFGFRSSVATGDAPTVRSALQNLQQRLGLSKAIFVSIDGEAISAGAPLSASERDNLFEALNEGATDGVLRLGDQSFSASAAQVRAPVNLGWVVFGNMLDGQELHSLAKIGALDLQPRLVDLASLPAALRASAGTTNSYEHLRGGERLLTRASPVRSFGMTAPQVLILEYSLTRAMTDYAPIYWTLFIAALIGVGLALLGSWSLARRISRPIRALEVAARQVSAGNYAQVAVETGDEIGTLAQSFNKMVDDIGERERQISHMAFHDALTGLANRSLLKEQLGLIVSRGSKARMQALLCLDLDNFKTVNDTLGHPVGDALLCEIADRLRRQCANGFVARLGGDEFAVVIDQAGTTIERIAADLAAAVARPATIEGHRILPKASIGIAIIGQDGGDVTELLKNADLALYRAKNEEKGGFRFFEASMDAEAQARRKLELDLTDALALGQLSLKFQPLFNLSEGRISAFEALLRWDHPVRGSTSPLEFIPLAEETGLILPIGEWVMREACRVASHWPDHIRVAVNVSAVQFRNPGLSAVITSALAESGLAPSRLELEITESLFIDNLEGTLSTLHGLRSLGVRVALDDFGTGYSSLSYLRSFPFDKIKIDRSFIIDLLSNKQATAIIHSITSLAEALGMETTAEGVEYAGQLDILREQGCSQIQGFYFSEPLAPEDIYKLLDEEQREEADKRDPIMPEAPRRDVAA